MDPTADQAKEHAAQKRRAHREKSNKTWRDHLDERMMRLRFSDESMIHYRKSNDYMSITRMNFKDTADDVNGCIEVEDAEKKEGPDESQKES